jgi:L-amino acid N-acyltransferase YncA
MDACINGEYMESFDMGLQAPWHQMEFPKHLIPFHQINAIVDYFQAVVTIRIVDKQDASAYVRIMNQAIEEERNAYLARMEEEHGQAWFISLLTQAVALISAVNEKNEVVGWGSLTAYRSGRGAFSAVYEVTFYVDKAHRREGVGRLLLSRLMEEADVKKATTLIAILLDDNTPSRKLLEALGFEAWAAFPNLASFPSGQKGHLYMGRKAPF